MAKAHRSALAGLAVLLLLSGQAAADLTVPAGAGMAVPGGGLDLGCTTLAIQGSLTLGAGQITDASPVNIAATGILDGGSGNIGVSGGWNNAGSFIPGSSTVVISNACGGTQVPLTGTTVFHNLTLTSANGGTFIIPAGHTITVNGTLTLQGTPTQNIQLVSSSGQTAFVALGPGAHVVSSHAIVVAGVQIGAAATAAQSIPTLNDCGLLILALLLGGIAAVQGRAGRLSKACRAAHAEPQGESRDGS